MKERPKLSFWQIWNMSFGFLGIQFGFGLQNANASRILQNFGADIESLSLFWLAAPITGMIIQPIIGYYSDKTWNGLGRRKPYFLAGAILTALALIFMPNSAILASILPPLIVGAGMLMIMDASINVAMEPFRALVADMLPSSQRTLGFAIQSFLIGVGAVVASALPWILVNWFGMAETAAPGEVSKNVIYSFYIGAVVLMGAILWTIFKTKEYPPEVQKEFHEDTVTKQSEKLEEESRNGFMEVMHNIRFMPSTMKNLGLVQFCSWFALFSLWVYTTPAVAEHLYGTTDSSSAAYNEAANWVGVLFGVYNFVAMGFALVLPIIARYTSRKITHAIALVCGGLGLISMYFFNDPNLLIISMIGVGIAWSSILSMPYAILAGSLPPAKMGVYMGIFNFFITLPQICNGLLNGPIIVRYFYDGKSIYALVTAGVMLLIGACCVIFVKDNEHHD
ncbi:MAG: MFS transporter [Bacteroidales bacterium]